MIERLARALEHLEELPEDMQVELAELIKQYQTTPKQGVQHTRDFAGIWRDLPDDMEDTLLRWQHEAIR